jgi:outer membrane protein W
MRLLAIAFLPALLAVANTAGEVEDLREFEVADHEAYGAQLTVRVSEDGDLELLYSRQDTQLRTDTLFTGEPVLDLALETWQLGGNYLFGRAEGRVRPYVGFGLGLTRLLPEPEGLENETRFSASIAGGVKLWLAKNLGLRFEVRGFFTVLESNGEVFCPSSGTCLVESRGSSISQAELRGGIVLRF